MHKQENSIFIGAEKLLFFTKNVTLWSILCMLSGIMYKSIKGESSFDNIWNTISTDLELLIGAEISSYYAQTREYIFMLTRLMHKSMNKQWYHVQMFIYFAWTDAQIDKSWI